MGTVKAMGASETMMASMTMAVAAATGAAVATVAVATTTPHICNRRATSSGWMICRAACLEMLVVGDHRVHR